VSKGRLEAFSDGVIAIIITIMVLEFKAPAEADWSGLGQISSGLLSYVLSFIYVGIYWNNHHHLFQAVSQVNGRVLWANLHLLFWLSLTPFVTSWLGNSHFASLPAAAYGTIFLLAGCAYYLLSRALISLHGSDSPLARAVGRDFKGIISLLLYVAGICLSFVAPWLACAIYAFVAVIWLIPDQRIEKALAGGIADE
jgi:uncharacterized membrane protein